MKTFPNGKRFIAVLLVMALLFGMNSFGYITLGNSINNNALAAAKVKNAVKKKKLIAKKNVAAKKKAIKKKKTASNNSSASNNAVASHDTTASNDNTTANNNAVSNNTALKPVVPNLSTTNPLIWADVPDPDVIRVGDYYYMVSTTMHLSPGVPIMRSTDLINWEIISYVYDTLANDDQRNLLNGKNMYGKGSWASSIRYNNGIFYVCFASNDLGKTFIFHTKDIVNGSWTKTELAGVYHDPSLLFDDGHVYIVSGSGTIRIKELTADATAIMQGGVDKVLVNTPTSGNTVNCEGSHFYKINGKYYLFLIQWPNSGSGRRIEWCYRSDSLLGTYTGKIVFDDNFGYGNSGVAQGGIVKTKDNNWYAVLFQDHGAVGRIPMLLPVTWTDDWPIMGENGKLSDTLTLGTSKNNLVESDEFTYDTDKLKLQWQWNHNPDNSLWSVTKNPSYLSLATGNVVSNIINARNTISQRTEGPVCSVETKLNASGMKAGDYAGIAAFQTNYGMLGIKAGTDGKKYVICARNDGTGNPKEEASVPLSQDTVYLKIDFIFNTGNSVKSLASIDKAYFSYSLDGTTWVRFNYSLSMRYTLDMFMGYRAALYNYATKQTGGYADFDYFHISKTIAE